MVVGLAVGAAAPASAATVTRTCPVQSNPCEVLFQATTSSVRVTVDKSGYSTKTLSWTLSARGRVVCEGTYRPVDPPRTTTCRVPLWPIVFSTPGSPGATRVTFTTGFLL